MVWPAVVAAAGSVIGSKISADSSARQASRNRAFQERMSNTAYQRAADDLEAAGLNRILALGSAASTPGGSMPTVPDYGSSFASGLGAGVNYMTGAQTIKQSEAQIDNIISQTSLNKTREGTELAKSQVMKAVAPILEQAAGDFGTLVDIIRDPTIIKGFQDIVKAESSKILGYLDTLLGDWYGSRYKGSFIQDMITTGQKRIFLKPEYIKND